MVEEETSDIKVLAREARKQLIEAVRELRIRVAESKSQALQLCALSDGISTTLNSAGIGITRCSRDLRYLQANERYATIAGIPLTQISACISDITSGKHAERLVAEHNAQLELADKVARIGRFKYDHATQILQLSAGCANIYGLPEGTEKISREDWRALIHPEDLRRMDTVTRRALANHETELVLEFRILRHGEVRWIESRVLILYNEVGRPVRRIGAEVDVTERKLAEHAVAERNAQLALAGRAALVGSYVYDVNKGTMQISEGYAAIHGLPEGATETSYYEWRARVHPEDLERAEGSRDQAFTNGWNEDNAEYRIVLSTGEVRWIERRGSISYSEDGRPERVVGVNIDVTERKRAEERHRVLIAELDHRVKNALATVSSVVSQTGVEHKSVAKFVAALDGRIRSMATTHELLSSSRWQGLSLRELIRRELSPYATPSNTNINGPAIVLRAEAGQAMAMVLHELTTNAAKYGALSTTNGRVSIRWYQRLNGRAQAPLVLEWQETGGPHVVTTGNPSYGTSIICDLIPYEFGGTVDLVLAPGGIRCHLELPADWLSGIREKRVRQKGQRRSHEPEPRP